MRFKSVLVFFLLITNIFCTSNYSCGNSISLAEICNKANEEIGSTYYDYLFFDFNLYLWEQYGVLAIGDVSGDIKYSTETQKQEHRYIGFTIDNEEIPNKYFPDDHKATTLINNWKWIEDPTQKGLGSYCLWDNKPNNEPYIKQALKDRFGNLFDDAEDKNWYKHVHILQPRTSVCDGVGRMWHKWDSNGDGIKENWYVSIIIPKELKPEVTAEFDIYCNSSLVTDNYNNPVTKASVDQEVLVQLHNQSSLLNVDKENCSYQWYADEGEGYVKIASTEHTSYLTKKAVTNFKLIIEAGETEKVASEVEHTFYLHLPSETPQQPSQPSSGDDSSMSSNATAIIQADPKGSETFDVVQGIPTGESVYVEVSANDYLTNVHYTQVTGTKYYTVNVNKHYTLKWEVDKGEYNEEDEWVENWVEKSDTTTVSQTYSIPRTYSYWQIDKLEVYGIDHAKIYNDALPNEQIVLVPNNYTQPQVDVWHSNVEADHIIEPGNTSISLGSSTLDGGRNGKPSIPSSNWTSYANAAVGQIQVKNDRFIMNNTTVLSDDVVPSHGPNPGTMPAPSQIQGDVLYEPGIIISHAKENRSNIPSTGTIHYSLVSGINADQTPITQPINGINSVTLHTPVICTPAIDNQEEYSQTIHHNQSLIQLQIENTIEVHYPTIGQHREIKGYGLRDYQDYVRERQILLPFDAYIGVDRTGTYISKGTWIDVPEYTNQMTLYIPSWVKEGTYDVLFRTIPKNYDPSHDQDYEYHANLNINNYKAVEKIRVQVTGRLYDFKITDISDWNWQSFFRIGENTPEHSGKYFYTGSKDKNGKIDTNRNYYLPVMENKNDIQGYESYGVKLGYKFSFDFITNGDYIDKYDCMSITPTYYYIDSNGNNRIEVDLYYETGSKLIKIGSEQDSMSRTMILYDAYRNITEQEILNTADALEAQARDYENKSLKDYQQLYLSSTERNIKKDGQVLLTEAVRTFVGNTENLPSTITNEEATQSVQKWYGEFYLPTSTAVVPIGTDLKGYKTLNVNEAPFLHDGYIVVNFKIEGIQDGDFLNPVQAYDNSPYNNQWDREGFAANQQGFDLDYEDVVLYYTDKRASQDYVIGR